VPCDLSPSPCWLTWLAHARQVVTKERLFEAVWPEAVVSEANGRGTWFHEFWFEAVWPEAVVSEGCWKDYIKQIRKTLRDTPHRPQYIATVHRRGYRFVARGNHPRALVCPEAAAQTTPVAAAGAPVLGQPPYVRWSGRGA